MTRVVLDTNVIVSALWSPKRACERVVELVLTNKALLCYSGDILREYAMVLQRDKFNFSPNDVDKYLNYVANNGLRIEAPLSDLSFTDESDRKFYETAKAAKAYLITGNAKHFPKEPFIVSPAKFLELLEARK
ncbi:MAG: putative toxin-antitoxin system toxin component, PIN family [Helicobacteraceae bacterium]|nr:putative toxin-antitoxin system toxin component, PIN family [Helicobacteraceae bacterium]